MPDLDRYRELTDRIRSVAFLVACPFAAGLVLSGEFFDPMPTAAWYLFLGVQAFAAGLMIGIDLGRQPATEPDPCPTSTATAS